MDGLWKGAQLGWLVQFAKWGDGEKKKCRPQQGKGVPMSHLFQ